MSTALESNNRRPGSQPTASPGLLNIAWRFKLLILLGTVVGVGIGYVYGATAAGDLPIVGQGAGHQETARDGPVLLRRAACTAVEIFCAPCPRMSGLCEVWWVRKVVLHGSAGRGRRFPSDDQTLADDW